MDAIFMCCSSLTTLWYFHMKQLPKNAYQSRTEHGYSVLTLKEVQHHNAGRYSCRAFKKKKMYFEDSAELKVLRKLSNNHVY